jgi:hypothetical protein
MGFFFVFFCFFFFKIIMVLSEKVTFLEDFGILMGHFRTIENSVSYFKIYC